MTLTEEDSILIENLYLLKGYGAKKTNKGTLLTTLDTSQSESFLH